MPHRGARICCCCCSGHLILDVATTDVKRADRAAAQPLQTQVSQSLTVTQVQMVKFTQPDKRRDTKTCFLKPFNWPNWGVCMWISPYTCVLSSLQMYQWCGYSDWHWALSVWHMMNLQSSTGSQHHSPWNVNNKLLDHSDEKVCNLKPQQEHTRTHLLQCDMSRCCRSSRAATDLRLPSVILGHAAAWSLLRPREPLHKATQLMSVTWLLPKVNKNCTRFSLIFVWEWTSKSGKWSHPPC